MLFPSHSATVHWYRIIASYGDAIMLLNRFMSIRFYQDASAHAAPYNPRMNSGRSRAGSLRDSKAFNCLSTLSLSLGIVPRIAK